MSAISFPFLLVMLAQMVFAAMARGDPMPSGETLTINEGWTRINDNVMGGISSSKAYVQDDILYFKGQLSLANNGGFVSLQRPLPGNFLSEASALCLRFRMEKDRQFQVRLRADPGGDGVAYRRMITTTGTWQSVQLDIASFIPVFRGRVLTGIPQVAQTIAPETIGQLGLLVGDKNTSPFTLQVNRIWSCSG